MIRYLDGRPVVETPGAARGGVVGNKLALVILATGVIVAAVVFAGYWRMV